MSDLRNFLLARIAEDEAVASASEVRLAAFNGVAALEDDGPEWGKTLVMDRDRLLAECEAKRAAIEFCWLRSLVALALPYAAHPDYREEWRP